MSANRDVDVLQAREVYQLYENMLTRQSTIVETKTRRHKIPYQHRLEDTLCYRKALDQAGLETERTTLSDSPPYGLYRGLTRRDLREEIETVRVKNQPEYRRRKETAAILREGSKVGKLIDQQAVVGKFDDIFQKKYDSQQDRLISRQSMNSERKIMLPPLPVRRTMMANRSHSPQKALGQFKTINRAATESEIQ